MRRRNGNQIIRGPSNTITTSLLGQIGRQELDIASKIMDKNAG